MLRSLAVAQENDYLEKSQCISEFEAVMVNNLLKLSGEHSVRLDQKLCYYCFNACSSSQPPVQSEISDVSQGEADKSYHDAEVDKDILNVRLVNLGCSQLNFLSSNERDKLVYGKRFVTANVTLIDGV